MLGQLNPYLLTLCLVDVCCSRMNQKKILVHPPQRIPNVQISENKDISNRKRKKNEIKPTTLHSPLGLRIGPGHPEPDPA